MATRTRRRRAATQSTPQQQLPPDIQETVSDTERLHGEGIIQLGNRLPRVNHVPTGCFVIDFGLLGGLPQGYGTMAYGYHSTGKSTLFLKSVAEYQRKHPDKWVVWIDTEGLYDPAWAELLGVDTAHLLHVTPDHGEQAVDIIDSMLSRESVGVIVLDSVPACVPMKVLENSAEDDTMAALPRLMGKFCSKYTTANNRERRKGHWVSFWYVNQLREKVGFVLGSPRHLPGGKQINHIATTKIWLKLVKEHTGKDEFGLDVPDFNEQAFKFEKTKHGSSLKEGAFQFALNPNNEEVPIGTYDNVHQVVTFGKKMGFITGGGSSWKCLTGETPAKRFQKLASIEDWLREEAEEYDTLARSIIAHQRVSKGLSPLPPDGYLVSPHGRLVRLPQD